jgi:selenide,water dikinase
MDRLNQQPVMSPAPPRLHAAGAESDRMLCAGCGSKVGPGALDAALADLPGPARADVATGPGDDAAILTMGKTRQVLSTDHLRAFWNDPYTFARIAAVHALGDIWAMGAVPQAVLAQIILPRMTDVLQQRTLAEIMQAASEVFTAEGAAIVGGHSTQGAELTLGFTVTGLAESPPITLSGGLAGDRLILTRAVGSGTLLAAEMAGRAHGDDVAAALTTMSTAQGDAARLLSSHAHAMTDVTGFGLAGHASRLAGASGLAAEIDLSAIPLYAGAEAHAEEGIRSSIWDANFSAVTYTGPDNPRAALLFDPQTSGGLLAAVSETIAEKLAADLTALGHTTAIIGTLTQGAPGQITAS